MHELSISQSVVELCAERAEGARVLRVTLRIGQLAAVMPDALRFCFDVCAKGTPLEGASLEIIEVPGLAHCRACGSDMSIPDLLKRCDCGSADLDLLAGEGMRIESMEVA